MSESTEKFIRAYEDLVQEVNNRAQMAGAHSFEIEKAAQRDRGVMRHRNMLLYIRDIRHALQHPKHKTPGHAVSVSSDFLAEVEDILSYLRKPPSVNSVGVARKEMKTAKPSDLLGSLADEMKKTGFSHLPILDERGVLIGVFNEAAIFDFLWVGEAQLVERSMKIEDILPHCQLEAQHTETFRFVRPGTPVDELIEMFRALESPMTRVGAVFVTSSGKADQPVHRLVTPWDVMTADSS